MLGFVLPASAAPPVDVLRVCSDAGNLPLSNDKGEGYENKIAEQLARDLGKRVEYTYFPQRLGFVRNTLRQRDAVTGDFKCDLIIGVPASYDLAATTRPYLHSTYAIVLAVTPEFAAVRNADDILKLPRESLQKLRFGVFGQSPGADWLLRNNLFTQTEVYRPQIADPDVSPASLMQRDLAAGKIHAAIVWGPIAGFLARERHALPAWRVLRFASDPTIRFDFQIAMGVRFEDKQWQATLDQWIATHQLRIEQILADYHVPTVRSAGPLGATTN